MTEESKLTTQGGAMKRRIVRSLSALVIAGTIAGGLSGGVAGAASPRCVPKTGTPPSVCLYQYPGENIIVIQPTNNLTASIVAGTRVQGAVVAYGLSEYGGAVYCSPTTHTYHLVYVTGGSMAHERELRVACRT
jgi:hypothetical protein